jgi:hypothetical protein
MPESDIAFWSLVAVAVFAYGIVLARWQRGIIGLILYLPFAGLATVWSYPAPPIVLLAKDLFLVVPTYLSFSFWFWKSRRGSLLPKSFSFAPLVGLVFLLILHLANPSLTNPVVGLIGLKVWLFYVPLCVLTYHLVDSSGDLISLFKVMAAVGSIPAIVGLVQAVLVYSGNEELAYGLYGSAAGIVTQGYARFEGAGGQGLVRVASTFSFPMQYLSFLITLLPVNYSLWRTTRRTLYLWTLSITVVAAILSGLRSAFVLIPAYFLLILLFEGNLRRLVKPLAVFAILLPFAFISLVWLLGSSTETLTGFIRDVVAIYAGTDEGSMIGELRRASEATWFGMGTGMGTGPARYATLVSDAFADSDLISIESFYAKCILEIGIPGLVVVLLIFGKVVLRGYAGFLHLRFTFFHPVAASLLSTMLLICVYLFKGSFIDYDPLNVYFWIFAGILMKLPTLLPAEGYE